MPMLGNLEFYMINDGYAWVDGGGVFGLVPRIIWEELRPPDDKNRLPFALYSLLIYSEGQTILVDTGYGRKMNEKAIMRAGLVREGGDLLDGLEAHGVSPNDIDIVLLTHLHADHCGGNTTRDDDGNLVPVFPNARYMVQRREFADAVAPNERTRATYFADNFMPLYETGQLELMDGDTRLTKQVRTIVARGHTRAQQLPVLESEGLTALFMADMASVHENFQRVAWITSFDVEPLESIETKRFFQQWAIERDAFLIFQHDTKIPIGKLRPDGRNFRVEPAHLV